MSATSEELGGSNETVLSRGLEDRKPTEIPLASTEHRKGLNVECGVIFTCWIPPSVFSKSGSVNRAQEDEKKGR